jgi:[ribosomal protein S18]-alanine N-acetyltransferase
VTREIAILAPPAAYALAEALALLHSTCFAADPWDAKAIREIAGLAGFFAVIVRESAEPVAFAFAFGFGDEYEIASVGVVPQRRRSGIGTVVIDALCAEVRRRGRRSIVLEVAADNAAAQSLYRACGFVRAGWRPQYYLRRGQPAVDALVLRLALAPAPLSI